MKKKIILSLMVISAFFFGSQARADEGMWVMGNISHKTDSILHSLGLELTSDELYSTEHPSLNNAIVQFGGFCSGVVVSDQGLVFTNHHCGFGSIQAHSTTEHDYLKYGFVAKKMEDELPNEDLYVLFHLKTVDVTEYLSGFVREGMTDNEAMMAIDKAADELCKMINYSAKGLQSEINPFYKGSKFFLSIYQRYDDVRLVYAPPQCLGKYGGDTDNWMWPRQTCDFSVFRIYAGKNNEPAAYSKDNVPYRPMQYAKVSTQGYKEGSYAMTLGYPGSTDRYLSSYGVQSTMRTGNDVRYQVRTAKLGVLDEAMKSSDALRIMYASKYAQSSNYWKFSLGQNQALENLHVIADKQADEKKLLDWVMKDTVAHNEYVGILDSLKNGYASEFKRLYASSLWMECIYSGSDIMGFAVKNALLAMNGAHFKGFGETVAKTYKDIDVNTDKSVLKVLLKYYAQHVPDNAYAMSALQHEVDSAWNGNYDLYVDDLYKKTIFARPDELKNVSSAALIENDPMMLLANDALMLYLTSISNGKSMNGYERLLADGMREMNKDKEYYPDANFTMRLSYGLCKPIDFAPGTTGLKEQATALTTTPSSFINKHESAPDNYDYKLIPSVYKWMKKGRFSKKYVDPATGQLPLCFLTTNDITGGNSGSGVFDGKGRVIGLAFDGNWEAMSGDIKFDTALQRCIVVDIRYVLSVIGDYSKAARIINELKLD